MSRTRHVGLPRWLVVPAAVAALAGAWALGAFDEPAADRFFATFRGATAAHLVCEPRHPSWFEEDAERLLIAHRVARVAADPARVANADLPGGWDEFRALLDRHLDR